MNSLMEEYWHIKVTCVFTSTKKLNVHVSTYLTYKTLLNSSPQDISNKQILQNPMLSEHAHFSSVNVKFTKNYSTDSVLEDVGQDSQPCDFLSSGLLSSPFFSRRNVSAKSYFIRLSLLSPPVTVKLQMEIKATIFTLYNLYILCFTNLISKSYQYEGVYSDVH